MYKHDMGRILKFVHTHKVPYVLCSYASSYNVELTDIFTNYIKKYSTRCHYCMIVRAKKICKTVQHELGEQHHSLTGQHIDYLNTFQKQLNPYI
jgi:hypothetical protein